MPTRESTRLAVLSGVVVVRSHVGSSHVGVAMTWHISPTPTCIAKFVDGDFCGGELWVSGTFDNMADWLASNGFDVQVARLELCCPCCRIFETSTSKKFWAGGVHAVAFSRHRHQKIVGHPQFAYFGRFKFLASRRPPSPSRRRNLQRGFQKHGVSPRNQ